VLGALLDAEEHPPLHHEANRLERALWMSQPIRFSTAS
jgi:hypothetical protein